MASNNEDDQKTTVEARYKLKEYPVYVSVEFTSPPWKAILTVSTRKSSSSPEETEEISILDLADELDQLGLNIDRDSIQEVVQELDNRLDEKESEEEPEEIELELASGKEPVNGRDACVILQNKKIRKKSAPDTEENVDHREIKIDMHNVKKNDSICTVLSHTEGEAGVDVYGNELSVEPGEPLELKPGENVQFRSEKGQFIALEDGCAQVDKKEEEVRVETEFTVDGDVDYSVGNLNFPGSLHIRGEILPGFEVRAKKNITVDGKIHDAIVEAGGNIEVKGGVVGKGEGHVKAGGTIEVTYLNNCDIQSDDDLFVKGEIVNSTVRTDGRLMAKTGVFRGGKGQARKGIEISELGSKMNVKTTIMVGVGFRTSRRMEEVEEELKDVKNQIQRADAMVGKIKKNRDKLKNLPDKKKERIRNVLINLKELTNRETDLEEEKEELESKMMGSSRATIKVRKKIFPGVVLKLGDLRHQVVEPVDGPVEVYEDKNNLKINFRSITMDKFS